VVLLSVRPCCADTCNGDDEVKELTGTNTPGKKDCKGCSPFFSCGTCVGFTISKQNVCNMLLVLRNAVTPFTPYHQPNLKQVVLAIWQPPQLV
jgi:hypothetical protein